MYFFKKLWKCSFKCFLWFFKVQWVQENQSVKFLVVPPKDGLAPKYICTSLTSLLWGGGCNFQNLKCSLGICKHWWISFIITKTHSHSSKKFVFGKEGHFQTFKCCWDLMDINEYDLGKNIVKGTAQAISGHSLKLYFCMFGRSQVTHNYLDCHIFFWNIFH